MTHSAFAVGMEVLIRSSGWSRSPGQFAKVERITPAGWIVVDGSTYQPHQPGGSTAFERGGRRQLRLATPQDHEDERLHLLTVEAGRLQDQVRSIRTRDLDLPQCLFVIAAFKAAIHKAGLIGREPEAETPMMANPVAWERETSNGWVTVAPEDLDHYRGKGQRIRALAVIEEDPA